MSLILSGTDGLSDVDGTAATPAIRGTDANTGIFFPAADTIAFAEGGAEVARFDSSGNFGIGTVAPLGKVHASSASSGATPSANGNQLVAESSTNAGLTIATGATSLGNIFFADSGDSADGFIQYDQSGRSMRFGTATAEKMRLDASGNLGLGVTPSAWQSGFKAIQLSGLACWNVDGAVAGSATYFGNNVYRDSVDSRWEYIASGDNATQYLQASGQHIWRTAASGTAGNAITFTQAMTLTADGNLGIGTTNPGTIRLELSGAAAGSSFNAFRIGNTDTTASSPVTMFFLSADDGTARNRATISGGSDGSNNGYIALSTRSSGSITEKLRLNSTGAVVLAGGSTSATGVGITFPATQSASSNANTLDDYEEGTFTPTCTLTTPGTSSTGSAAGFYTKVGNLVTATGRLTFTKGTGSGDLSLGGLPFAATNTSLYQSSGALSLDTFGVAGKVYYIIIAQNSTAPSLVSATQAGGAAAAASASDFGSSGAGIRYMFSYQV